MSTGLTVTVSPNNLTQYHARDRGHRDDRRPDGPEQHERVRLELQFQRDRDGHHDL